MTTSKTSSTIFDHGTEKFLIIQESPFVCLSFWVYDFELGN